MEIVTVGKDAALLLPARPERSNKGTFGKVLVFAGCNEMPGAAALACSASYMVGAGLVCACVLPDVAKVIHHWQREVVTRIVPGKDGMYCKDSLQVIARDINNYSVIALGPGIGRSASVTDFVREILNIAEIPLVLDADALFAVSEDVPLLKTLKAPCVITPHFGEMSRLTGKTVPQIMETPVDTAVNFAREYNVITLLKDARTVIAHPNGEHYINPTGSNALAKGGTGDVLTGMIAGFIAQGSLTSGDPFVANKLFACCKLSAYIHGRAGETAAEELSNYSVTASDIIKFIPQVIKDLISLDRL